MQSVSCNWALCRLLSIHSAVRSSLAFMMGSFSGATTATVFSTHRRES